MSITFVKPRFYYDSYTDFWSLVELSGFEWRWMDEINLKSNHTYIVTMVDQKRDKWHLSWWQRKRKRARLIFWDLERPRPRLGIEADKRFLDRLHFDEVWNSDPQLAKDLGTRFVIFGSDRGLGHSPAFFKKYNFAHMSYINGRRGVILEKLKGVAAPNGYGPARHKILSASRFGLSIHQDNDLYYEPMRLALFAAYSLPTIIEYAYDYFPIGDCVQRFDFTNFDFAKYQDEYLKRYKEFIKLGRELHQRLCIDYRFKNVVEYVARN